MKHLYLSFSKTVILILSLSGIGKLHAQNETGVTNSNCGVVTQNFNNGTGDFTSKSLYFFDSGIEDSSFYYNATRGFWTEMGSAGKERTLANGAVPPSPGRYISILSALYKNPNPAGTFDVGFYYIVPDPNVDQFAIQLQRITVESNGATTRGEVARTSLQSFAAFSTPTLYTDPSNPLHNGWEGAVCIRLIDPDITEGPTTYYQVSVAYRIRGGSTFTAFDDFSLGNIEQAPLPVTFMGLVGKRENNAVELKWNVADEKDVKEYLVERSGNGTSFETTGSVAPQGKSIYSFTDPDAKNSAVFYRIKSVDIDGKFKYSSIIRLNANGNSFSNVLKVYPVPAITNVTLQHNELGAGAKISISTADGRTVRTVNPASGTSHTPINLSGINSGMYIIRVDDGKGKIETIKFVKQ